mmetsp:Transcript_91044/g.208645  ORF Transcript_91044/g.208645 Transcript_91044/m.208645 type:complete len:607 (-) Transcript_91044:393-2213(-)
MRVALPLVGAITITHETPGCGNWTSAPADECPERFACAICIDLVANLEKGLEMCHKYNSCGFLNSSTVAELAGQVPQEACEAVGLCSPQAVPYNDRFRIGGVSPINMRVTKALGSRGYNQLRISVVTNAAEAGAETGIETEEGSVAWSYQSQFQQRWYQYYLKSAVVGFTPGEATTLTVEGQRVVVDIPAQGQGTVGLIVADPCISADNYCIYQNPYNMKGTLQSVINSMSKHRLDYWMNVGDLFYDLDGTRTNDFFSGLSLTAMSKVHGVTMGNHDYWIGGSPGAKMSADSFGTGHMQWYALDTMASKDNPAEPFDFSVSADSQEICAVSNSFWYNAVGNVGFIGFSNAYEWWQLEGYFQEACAWAQETQPQLVVLLGHWDAVNLGCQAGEDTPDVFRKVQSIPACSALGDSLKYVVGHNHCNEIMQADTGFMLGAFGMSGCGQFGLPVLDTRNNRAKLYYFKMGTGGQREGQFQAVLDCLDASGFDGCLQYADTWMDVALAPAPAPGPAPGPAPTPAGSWVEHAGVNCYGGHGGQAVPGGDPYSTSMSLADCQAACTDDSGCTAIVRVNGQNTGNCWRRMNVDLSACETGSGYTTYTKETTLLV